MSLPVNPDRTPTEVRSCAGTPEFFLQVALFQNAKPVIQQQQKKVIDALQNFSEDQIIDAQPSNNLYLVYNKFNVVKRHYLLVAQQFRHQLELLTLPSFIEIHKYLDKYPTLSVIYNGGRRSGSSQPRQHIQLLQLQPETPLDKIIHAQHRPNGTLPQFEHKLHGFIRFKNEYDDIGLEFTPENVLSSYLSLISSCKIVTQNVSRNDIPEQYPEVPVIQEPQTENEDNCKIAISGYSLFITRDYIFMANRKCEGGFNSIAFSGFAFAKTEEIARQIEEKGLWQLLSDTLE
ncbi:ATP_adenylyltransferase [Hexamita inflata]|uniref:ATP adenylyltransferase n=1 Tax=Hexamita inflata TaxID=28002 RepID=A0AA86PBW4_9EUKA|nr:ATP adenylyltransferase [Hexamita inflata]CAI9968346.1 ATP adenylyltransferase [Hexamita inflata]